MIKDIIVLAPIEDIYNKAQEIIEECGYNTVKVVLGTMSQGVKIAKELEAKGAKAIVTRGGTYNLVKQAVKIPVIEIKVGAYDLIESFEKLPDSKEEVALVGYNNIVYGFDLLKRLISNKVIKIELKNEEDVYSVIKKYKAQGINTYIGDSNIIASVKELQCKGILVNSQKESIHIAVQEARRITRAINEEHIRAQQITTMADCVYDGILAIDSTERIIVLNKAAERIFGIKSEKVLNKKVEEVIPHTMLPHILKTGERHLGEVETIRELKVSCNRVPIKIQNKIIGAVATVQEIAELQSLEHKIRRSLVDNGFTAKYNFSNIICKSNIMEEVIETAKEYAKYDAPIHLCGESGVGKELICQSIHNISSRSKGPFVAINCAAIPPQLIESEFFGYEEGSFTGAKRKGKPGVFELAHNGTLFLDEISEIPKELQGRLLRVLQEKQIMRIGADKIIPIDVKIITASNKYLKRLVAEDKFRKDLYFRINVLALRIPGLKKRREDILPLAEFFISKYCALYNKPDITLPEDIKDILYHREYEGNVRELENLMERSVILSTFQWLKDEAEELNISNSSGDKLSALSLQTLRSNEPLRTLKELEGEYIKGIYNLTGNNINKSCSILGINRTTLWRKLKEINPASEENK